MQSTNMILSDKTCMEEKLGKTHFEQMKTTFKGKYCGKYTPPKHKD
jgi:hypothetical protein